MSRGRRGWARGQVQLPPKDSYAMAALRRRFNDLDLDKKGTITEDEVKNALVQLALPASEERCVTARST